MKRHLALGTIVAITAGLFGVVGCQEKQASQPIEPKVEKLVVYSGRSQLLVKSLLDKFTTNTGIQLDVRYDKSTQALATRLAAEGADTPADIFFAQDSGYLGALAANGFLAKLSGDVLSSVGAQYSGPQGHWVGTSGRARVLVYDPTKLKSDDLPKSLAELADPKWKGRIGWAPSNASFQAHVSGLRHIWGEDKTREWLAAMQKLEPKVYPKNSPQVRAVSNGEIEIGWVNHYYLHKLRAADPELKAANYTFRSSKDAGNVMMLSGIAITEASKHKDTALKLVRFLLSEAVQKRFAQEIFEYPTRPGVMPHVDVPAITQSMATMDQTHLADVQSTLKMLRDLELL